LEKNVLGFAFFFDILLFSTPNLTMYHSTFLWLNNKNIELVQQKQVIYEKCGHYAQIVYTVNDQRFINLMTKY